MLTSKGLSLLPALGIAVCAALAFSMSLHRFVLRPRAEWPPGVLILITLGAAFVARGVMILMIGTEPRCRSRKFFHQHLSGLQVAPSHCKALRWWFLDLALP